MYHIISALTDIYMRAIENKYKLYLFIELTILLLILRYQKYLVSNPVYLIFPVDSKKT